MRILGIAAVVAIVAAVVAPGAVANALPSTGAADYQLSEPYSPAAGVTVVVRDSTTAPASGLYNICYVNGFQTQPDESATWLRQHAALVLRDVVGEPVADPGWPDEYLLDTSTQANREALVEVMTATIQTCATKGYQAVEFDNLDSYTRSRGLLTAEDNFAYAGELIAVAHGMGLQTGQKNAAENTSAGKAAGFDFAIAEECAQYDECSSYTDVYGDQVIAVEYTDNLDTSFTEVCAEPDRPAMTILRDRDLVAPGHPDYEYDSC